MSNVTEHYVSAQWRPDERARVGGEIIAAINRHRSDVDENELYRWYRLIPKLVRLESIVLEEMRSEFSPFVIQSAYVH